MSSSDCVLRIGCGRWIGWRGGGSVGSLEGGGARDFAKDWVFVLFRFCFSSPLLYSCMQLFIIIIIITRLLHPLRLQQTLMTVIVAITLTRGVSHIR